MAQDLQNDPKKARLSRPSQQMFWKKVNTARKLLKSCADQAQFETRRAELLRQHGCDVVRLACRCGGILVRFESREFTMVDNIEPAC